MANKKWNPIDKSHEIRMSDINMHKARKNRTHSHDQANSSLSTLRSWIKSFGGDPKKGLPSSGELAFSDFDGVTMLGCAVYETPESYMSGSYDDFNDANIRVIPWYPSPGYEDIPGGDWLISIAFIAGGSSGQDYTHADRDGNPVATPWGTRVRVNSSTSTSGKIVVNGALTGLNGYPTFGPNSLSSGVGNRAGGHAHEQWEGTNLRSGTRYGIRLQHVDTGAIIQLDYGPGRGHLAGANKSASTIRGCYDPDGQNDGQVSQNIPNGTYNRASLHFRYPDANGKFDTPHYTTQPGGHWYSSWYTFLTGREDPAMTTMTNNYDGPAASANLTNAKDHRSNKDNHSKSYGFNSPLGRVVAELGENPERE